MPVRLKRPSYQLDEPGAPRRTIIFLRRMTQKLLLPVALLLAIAAPLACPAQVVSPPTEDKIYVGILDDAREDIWNGKTGPIERRVVMPAFEKTSSEWRSVTHFWPLHMEWTVAFDGKNLGKVESQATAPEGDGDQINSDVSRARQVVVTPGANVPTVGKPSEKFSGASGFLGPLKVLRPLILVSKPYFSDPDGWKRTQLPEAIGRRVRQGFRKQYPHVDRCKDESIAEHDWKSPDSALMLVSSYGSNKNSFLVAVRLSAGDCGWGGQPDDPLDSFVSQWFFVAPDQSVRRIGGFDQLLDAGDYDNDGSSELIFFSVRSENSDAYDLVYDNFQKKVDLEVGYH
jgi:hypothetical protein